MIRVDDLQFEGLKIYQDSEGYCFTSDSVLLANYAKCLKNEKVVEFCAGSGVISLLFSRKQKPSVIHAFEIQKELYDLFEKSIKLNNINNIIAHNEDIKNASKVLGNGYADVVICNPPYFLKEQDSPVKEQFQIATQEICATLDDIVKSANDVLKFGGNFYMVHRVDRIVDVFVTLRKYKLEPKNVSIIYPGKEYEPVVFLVKATKGGKPGVRFSKITYNDDYNKSFQSF